MPKKKFLQADNVRWAKLLPCKPAFITRRRSKGRFAVGVRYEKSFQEHMGLLVLGVAGLQYLEGPWFEFQDDNGRRWCQADGVLLDHSQSVAIIYEVKYQHTLNAWWQLTYLYEPVVRKLYPGWTVGRMEVVHWHDPSVTFPQGYDLTDSPLRAPHANRVAVYIFNSRRLRRVSTTGHGGSEGGGEVSDKDGSVQIPVRSVGAA